MGWRTKRLTFVLATMAGLVAALGSAGAAELSAALNNASVCPCSAYEQDVTISNGDYRTDTFSLSSSVPWAGFAKCDTGMWDSRVTLSGGESTKCNMVIAPPCNISPGRYDVQLVAASATTGESSATHVTTDVLNCHGVKMNVPDMRACIGDSLLIPVNVTNTGAFNETLRFSSSLDGAFYDNNMTAASGSTITNLFSFRPQYAGNMSATVWASSPDSSASKQFSIKIAQCFGFGTKPDAPRSLCVDKTGDITLEVTNNGLREDVYYVDVNSPDSNETEKMIIDLNASDRTVITKKITPTKPALKTFYFTITSAATGEKKTEKTDTEALECRSFEMSVNPLSQSVCKGNDANLSVTVKNTGIGAPFNLSFLDNAEIYLLPGERRDIELNMNTLPLPFGHNPVTLNVSTGPLLHSETANINLENCYGAKVFAPELLRACPCSNRSYSIQLRNSGRVADDYTVSASGWSDTAKVRLQPSTSRNIMLYVAAPCEPGLYALDINATSSHFSTANRTALLVTGQNCGNDTVSEHEYAGAALTKGEGVQTPLAAIVAIFVSAIVFSLGFSHFMIRKGRKMRPVVANKVNKGEGNG